MVPPLTPPFSWNLRQAPCGCRSYIHSSWRESRKPILMKSVLSLTEGELPAGRWNCPNHSWWEVGAGERRRIMKLTSDLSVSSTYSSHCISTCNNKWKTDLNTGEMTAWHLEQPVKLSPLSYTVLSSLQKRGRVMRRSLILGLKSQAGKILSRQQTVPPFISLSQKCQGIQRISSECNHQFQTQLTKTRQNILRERIRLLLWSAAVYYTYFLYGEMTFTEDDI